MKRKKKKIEREADSRYVERVRDVEWERNAERERKKELFWKEKEKKKIYIYIC